MANSLNVIQAEVKSHFESINGFPWFNVGIPDGETVRKVNNQIQPYYAYQFGDLQAEGATNMATPLGDDYQMPIYVQAIASDAGTAQRMANDVVLNSVGVSFTYSGSLRKRPGGVFLPLQSSNSSTQAYVAGISFGLLVQLSTL